MVEFTDFQCAFCSRVGPTLDRVCEEYGDQVRIVFRHLPLPNRSKALAAHAAAEAAHREGRFWEVHDAIFGNQQAMSAAQYVEYAREMGLDLDQFERDRISASVQNRVEADVQEAAQLGVSGTPACFINSHYLSGAKPFESFKVLVDEELGA